MLHWYLLISITFLALSCSYYCYHHTLGFVSSSFAWTGLLSLSEFRYIFAYLDRLSSHSLMLSTAIHSITHITLSILSLSLCTIAGLRTALLSLHHFIWYIRNEHIHSSYFINLGNSLRVESGSSARHHHVYPPVDYHSRKLPTNFRYRSGSSKNGVCEEFSIVTHLTFRMPSKNGLTTKS